MARLSGFEFVGSSSCFPLLNIIALACPLGFCCGCPRNVPAGAEDFLVSLSLYDYEVLHHQFK
ncbi:hypothetical protein L195_g058933, partial [Trifolium pratense]